MAITSGPSVCTSDLSTYPYDGVLLSVSCKASCDARQKVLLTNKKPVAVGVMQSCDSGCDVKLWLSEWPWKFCKAVAVEVM